MLFKKELLSNICYLIEATTGCIMKQNIIIQRPQCQSFHMCFLPPGIRTLSLYNANYVFNLIDSLILYTKLLDY